MTYLIERMLQDVLVYEAPLVRNMTSRDPFLRICGSQVRDTLGLTRDQYIDFAILLGTDFSQRITNVGPVRAFKFIKEFRSIENIVDSIASDPKYSLKIPRAAYLAQVDIARAVFKTLPTPSSSEILRPVERNNAQVEGVLKKYGILDRDIHRDWHLGVGHEQALVGNYFNDSPVAA